MKMFKLLGVLTLLPFIVMAWDGTGHSTCGAIAYYYLKGHNPAVITKVVTILQQHPWYNDEKHWGAKLAGLQGDQRDVMLFMLASTFSDDARSVPELGGGEHGKWHYVDYPFVPTGSTVTGKEPGTPNAQLKIAELVSAMPKETDPAQKAIELCWLFHLIEDIHQPLHTVSMYDANHPDGDKGGNTTFIIVSERTEPTKLHYYWDDLVKGSIATAPDHAQALLAEDIYSEQSLHELRDHTTVDEWIVKESFPMAKEVVYENGSVNGTSDKPTIVTPEYEARATKLGERRVVLAGIRVAKELTMIL